MRIDRWIAVIAGLAALVTARAGAAQGVCPPEEHGTRAQLVRLLTSESRAEARQRYGLANVYPANLVLLEDTAFDVACQHLRKIVKPGPSGRYPQVFSYYYADGFYFAAFAWVVPPGEVWPACAPVLVFKSDMSHVATFAM